MFKKLFFVLLFPYFYSLSSSFPQVDILADFDLIDIPTDWTQVKALFDVRLFSFASIKGYKAHHYKESVKRIIFMNPYVAREKSDFLLLPREKTVLFCWEPAPIDPFYLKNVGRVYTYNDMLLDNKHFFKFFYPYAKEMISEIPSFEQKKFCTLVTRHFTPERIEVVKFFNNKKSGEFDFYGANPGPFEKNKNYKGPIPGYHSGLEKVEILKNYKFCMCFENTYHLKGYITEKIFSCFSAGCVPIYYGAPNVYEYIPKNCFIDYRDFSNLQSLYQFLKRMSGATYQRYIDNIKSYLLSSKVFLFSPQHFEQIIINAVKAF